MENKNRNLKINKLPVSTWNWLKMNESNAAFKYYDNAECNKIYDITDKGVIYDNTERMKELNIESGMGIDLLKINPNLKVKTDSIYIKPNMDIKSVLKLSLRYHDNKESINNIEIYAAENSRVTVIMEYEAEYQNKGNALIQTNIYAEKGAEINLIQVQLLGNNFDNFNNIGGRCEDNASINIKQIILGASKRYYASMVDLSGKNSKLTTDICYIGKNNQSLDMNYIVNHQGKKSNSNINVLGVLQDSAFKLFRGTIEFKRGAAGASGQENENVLLIGEKVRNKTIPVILCKEEDVEGNHGATIGKIDSELLFYLASRGLDLKEAYKLLERSRIDSLCRKIDNQEVSRKVIEYMESEQEDNE